MPRRKWSDAFDVFGGVSYEVPRFSTGEAAQVLRMPIWRLQKFLDLDSYALSPTSQLGRGQGKRRMFSTEGLYRVAIADFLLKDGFAPKLVAEVLKDIEDKEFIDYDAEGEATLGVYMIRDPITRKRFVKLLRPDRWARPKNAYYSLDFGIPMREVDQGIREALEKRKRET